jgi:hypothetical protein
MKRIFQITLLGASLALALPASVLAREVATVGDAREELARGVATLAADPAFDHALREHVAGGKASLAEVLTDIQTPSSAKTVDRLRDLERKVIELRGLTGALDALIDVRVHGVANGAPLPAAAEFWTGTVTREPTSGAKHVVAFDPTGKEQRFALDGLPAVPMLLVESDSSAAMQAGVSVMNETLRRKGLQGVTRPRNIARLTTSDTPSVEEDPADRKTEQLTLLKSIYLENDHEPNSAGDADVFAIVSGVGPDGKAQVITKDMPWLDHDKRWYTPRMDLINWTDYGTNYVNVQLFEDDGDTNYKAIAEVVIDAVGDLSVLISPEAPPAIIVAGVSKIANAVLKAMPVKWFENAPDYIDSFYVIERGGNYGSDEKPLTGARGQAHIVLMPHTVKNP